MQRICVDDHFQSLIYSVLLISDDRQILVREAAARIHAGFISYNDNYRRITRRARARFEKRDWGGARDDLSVRIELYDKSVSKARDVQHKLLSHSIDDLEVWREIRQIYWNRVDDIPDGEFSKTFFNSVYRDVLRSLNIDPTQVSDTADVVLPEAPIHYPARQHNYINWGSLRDVVERLLDEFRFKSRYANFVSDVDFVCTEIEKVVGGPGVADESVRRIEVMHDIFFQSSRAFIVGKLFWADEIAPFVLAFENGDNGVCIEAVLTSEDDASVLFGFTRSYFMVDVEPVAGAVYFIQSMMPHKRIDELYTILGRARQGKTERFRAFHRHLADCSDFFVHTVGDRGLVMLVFTLPSHDLVFKVIRDDFGHPKNISHEEVKKKYKFVFTHDRAGRLIDTQEFRNIEFPINKFNPELLSDLLESTSQTVRLDGDHVVIDHLYTERRLTPLNLFVRDHDYEQAKLAMLDYGQAIKDLAMTNIFPGDLLLKNFGVSRHGRVIFYDYDELCLLTDCHFRDLPNPEHPEDELRAESWFYVDKFDIFPEEFIRFLAIDESLRTAFLARHGDLLTAGFWREIKRLHTENVAPEVAPYYHIAARRESN